MNLKLSNGRKMISGCMNHGTPSSDLKCKIRLTLGYFGGVLVKTRKIEVTVSEIVAIKDATDTLRAMAGCSDDFTEDSIRMAKHVDAMLKRNNLKPRDFA